METGGGWGPNPNMKMEDSSWSMGVTL
jgi:hypothetical protein